MRLWSIILFASFLSAAHAGIMDVSEEITGSPAAIAGLIPSPPKENDKQTGKSLAESASSLQQEKDKNLPFVPLAGERSTTPAANTPGGGVPRLREEVLILPSEDIPWWEQWWKEIVTFFCETKDTPQ